MTSVEKRHSGRRSGGHRKHSDGGFSDTSSGGSFLDETDREVSNLTDRAFRSLCIGDDAVYNDSDLCCSSPSTQRERQQAFSQNDQDKENREREDLKRAALESFSLRVQQYGQDWIHKEMYGPETRGDPRWGVYGEGRTGGRVSATFQHSFMEMPQQEKSLREEHLSFLSNGATEFSSQQRRSRSRVSSLIKAFNSEGYRDGGGVDGKLGEWNNETTWDKSALMSIERELSEFSTAYHQNFNSGPFPSTSPFPSQDNRFYSSEVATTVAHMNSASSFMRSSHSKHSMSTQVNSNPNFFMHSEFSPFKVWRDHNRFPFQHVSGFMPRSEFPKWYETPMYKELTLGSQPQGPSMFEERGVRPQRKNLAPLAPHPPPNFTSTKASALEKRCESELAGHYPHWKRTQGLGTNRLPSQRPSTVSPTIEMSRRARETFSSTGDLQKKLTTMTSEQYIKTEMTANQQGVLYSKDSFIPFGNNNTAVTAAQNVVSSNTSTTPFNISQLLTPVIHTHQETETSEVQQYAVSPPTVEHPPVRAESRGATPDVRMSSYKSRATSLLFNLKDNRKRVKSTYSPTKFKGMEIMDKNKQPYNQDGNVPKDTVIDIPDFPDRDIQIPQVIVQESSTTDVTSHQLSQEHHSPGLPLMALTSQPTTAHTGQHSEYTSSDYLTAQMQGEMVHHVGFNSLMQENYTNNKLVNGQNLHEDLSSFTPYKQGKIDKMEILAGDVYTQANSNKSGVPNSLSMVTSPRPKTNLSPKPSNSTTDTSRLNPDYISQNREYQISKANTEQMFSESIVRGITKVDRYEQVKENKYGCSDVSSQDRWQQQVSVSNATSQDGEMPRLKAATSPWKGDISALTEKDQHAQSFQRVAMIKDELHSPRDKCGGENKQNVNKEQENTKLSESLAEGTSSQPQKAMLHSPYHTLVNPNLSNQLQQYAPLDDFVVQDTPANEKQQPGVLKDKYKLQNYYGHNEEHKMKENYLTQSYHTHGSGEQEYKQQTIYSNEDKNTICTQETPQRKQYVPLPKQGEVLRFQQKEAKQPYDHNTQTNSSSSPDKSSPPTTANQVKDRQYIDVNAEQTREEQMKAEMAKAQHAEWAQVVQTKAESARTELIVSGQTGTEDVNAEQDRANQTEAVWEKAEAKTKHFKPEQAREEQGRDQAEKAREEQTNTEQTRVQKIKEEQAEKHKTGKGRAEHSKQEQDEQVRAEQAEEAERIKEDQIKSEVAMAERARVEQAIDEQARRERIKAEQANVKRIRAEQAEAERIQAEQIRAEKIKAEQAEIEHKKAEQSKLEQAKVKQIKEQQAKAEQEKAKLVRTGKVKADHVKVEEAIEEKSRAELIQAGQVNAEQAKVGMAKAEQAKVELAKIERMKEESAKKAKLAEMEQVKHEPDKVEQVKTELAKAKAELARIKEKMRGEQKETVRNAAFTKEVNITSKDVPVKVKLTKNEEYKEHDQATQKHQQIEDTFVSKNGRGQTDRGSINDYERVREKYGFNNTVSTNRSAGNVSSKDDVEEAMNNKKSKEEDKTVRQGATAKTGDMERELSIKYDWVRENQYVYSESSKEFKLSRVNDLLTHGNKRTNSETVIDKIKDDRVMNEKSEKLDHLKHNINVSLQRDSDFARSLPLERRPKPSEHSVVPSKDTHPTPPRLLSSKERTQTKQEILTSKIKAHAEKEISAIKEKGFAIRDGFIPKIPTKQLAGNNVQQKPPSQEVSRRHESTLSNNITPKQQMGPLGMKKEPAKSVSPPSSATVPVKSSTTTSQLREQLLTLTQVPQQPLKSNNIVIQPPIEPQRTESNAKSIDEGSKQRLKKATQTGIKSPTQNKEQALNSLGKQEVNHEENSGKQNEGLKSTTEINTDLPNEKKVDPSQAKALVKPEALVVNVNKVESSKPEPRTPDKDETKSEAIPEDSTPSLKLVFGERETTVVDDSLQIMGIMVTVRERKPSMNNGQVDKRVQEETPAKEKEHTNSEPSANIKYHPSSGLELSKGNEYSKDVSVGVVKEKVLQETQPTARNGENKVSMNNHLKDMQETSNIKPLKYKTQERTISQEESSSIRERSPRETRLQDPLADKEVTEPAKNKVLAETQPLLFKQGIITRKAKDYTNKNLNESSAKSNVQDELKANVEESKPRRTQTQDLKEKFVVEAMNTEINYQENSNKGEIESLIKHDVQPSLKEDMTKYGINSSKSRNIDGESASLLVEKRHNSEPSEVNKNSVTGNENKYLSMGKQNTGTHGTENSQGEENVHIDGIAIRVVPVIEKDNQEVTRQHPTIKIPANSVSAVSENKQVALPSPDGKIITSKDEDRDKLPTPASKDLKPIKGSLEAQNISNGVRQGAHSLRVSDQHKNITATSENTQVENGNSEKVKRVGATTDETKRQPMEEDYFQLQGVIETNNDHNNNSANIGDMSDAVSQRKEKQLHQSLTGHARELGSLGTAEGGEIAGLFPDKASLSKEPLLECEPKSVKNEIFVLNETKNRTMESSPASDRNVAMEMDDRKVSKQSDGPTERQSNRSEKMEVVQAIHSRKHQTENQSNLSAKQRRSAKNVYPTRHNGVKENDYKPDVKPKPKEKVSTIPDISAIADYARLKVIAAEEMPNTMQELPPSKKEGFFPLIQTRHSRRPVFTTETQDLSVKEKTLAKETEPSTKVNKEPKALVFSTMEKEQKRTGMFKLGEKERQEKMLPDVQTYEGVTDTGRMSTQDLKQSSKPTPAPLKNPGRGEQEVVVADTQRLNQEGDQSIYQPHNPPMPPPTSISSINKKTRNASLPRHLDQLDNSVQVKRPQLFPPTSDRIPDMDKSSHPQPTLGQICNMEVQRKDERIENQKDNERPAKIEERIEKQGQERLATQCEEESKAKQKEAEWKAEEERRAKQLEEERAAWKEEEKRAKQRAEEIRIKQIKEERRAALVEEERRAAQREEERRTREREAIAVKIEERREKLREVERRAEEERRAKQAEEERRAKQAEEERRTKQAEEEKRAKQAEEEKRAKQAEEERRAKQAEEEKRTKQAEEEKRAKQAEEERRAKQAEEERRAKQAEAERAARKEEERRAKRREEERRIKELEEERRAKQREEQRAAREEEERRAAREVEEKRAAREVEERRATQIEETRRAKQREEEIAAERRIKQIEEERRATQIEEEKRERQREEEQMAAQREEERRAAEKEEKRAKQREQRAKEIEEERIRQLDKERQAAQKEEEKRVARERMLAQREEENMAKQREEEEKFAAQREEERASQREEQRSTAQRMDALQYYAITSTESERRPRDRHLRSPLPPQRRVDSTEDSGSYSRPYASPSPALSLPRSNTSSPALGAKPSMFRVKDNSIRGSSLTKSVKPRFHKSFGEEFRVGSPLETWRRSERGEEEQNRVRRSAGTPIHPDTASGLNRLPTVKESPSIQPGSSLQEYSAPLPEYKAYSRRSIALDEDDSRSVISNISEDVESFATSAADLADLRGLYDYDRPESACSFSSDVARSLGKPPTVAPKSEKALRRAKRLTTRRIQKEFQKESKTEADTPIPAEKPIRAVSSIPSSPTELRSSNRHVLASPHFCPPISLSHAPAVVSSVPSSHTELRSSYRSFHASPHATTPVSLPVASPHAGAPVSLPVASPHATAPVSLPVASPHATAPVSLPVASPHATAPVSLPVASPHATAPVSLPVASPHATAPVSLPVASPHATAPVSLPVASPHATAPVSLPVASPHATAPVSLPVASPHATAPVSLPVASPHATAPVSLPVASPHATASLPVAPKTVASVPSSPTLHHTNHPAPVTQYHVEPSYAQSFPVTQRKVLQDPGSGQYFVVDMPVQVKTKTFFDPETGKYVQLNVRQSAQSGSRLQSQPAYSQPQPQLQVQPQQKPQASPAGNPYVLYQGYKSYPQGYQPVPVSSLPPHRSSSGMSVPATVTQDPEAVRESQSYGYQENERGQNSEQTPYMDTAYDTGKTHNTNTDYNTHGSCPDTNSQLAGSSVYENDSSAHSRLQPRDIITMSELEDFMDW